MTKRLVPSQRKVYVPRRLVPKNLQKSKVGTVEQGALSLAYLIRRRIHGDLRSMPCIVLVDIDGACYACRGNKKSDTGSVADILREVPHIVCGLYDETAEVGLIAADVEMFIRERRAAA